MKTYRGADLIFVSHPKAGRTWIRFMLIKTYAMLDNDDKKTKLKISLSRKQLPCIKFYHDGWRKGTIEAGTPKKKVVFQDIPTILLLRDPRDIIVSFYFHLKSETSISKFIRKGKTSFEKLLQYIQIWNEAIKTINFNYLKVIRYEDFKKDDFSEYKKLINWIKSIWPGWPKLQKIDDNIIRESVKYASFDNMRKMELDNVYKNWAALHTKDKSNIENLKVRKGKVGGYVDYLSKKDIDFCNSLMAKYNCELIEQYTNKGITGKEIKFSEIKEEFCPKCGSETYRKISREGRKLIKCKSKKCKWRKFLNET